MSAPRSSPTPPVIPVAIGEVISNKFRVDRILGSGGNGVVVLATHLQLDERVALKFLTGDPQSASKVAEGARATVKLRSDHVARVFDIGRHESTPYVVMEYLEGEDLEALVRRSGRLDDIAEAVELVLQSCEAVAEAHRAGVVHRDLKLANIFLVATRTGLPRVKLLDFGIARLAAEGTDREGMTVGTPQYMAPERILGIDDDPRSDVWSLGVVLYELLSGYKPFRAEQTVALFAEVLEQEHPPLFSTRDDIATNLSAVIDRCLAKDPELRFQSAGELASALAPFAPVRAQVHVERALEYGRPPPPPSSSPSIESARRTLAKSSRALRASRGRASTTSGASASRSFGSVTLSPKRRRTTLVLWTIAGMLVVGGVVFVTKQKLTGAPLPSPAASPPPESATPLQGWTVVAPDTPNTATPQPLPPPSASTARPPKPFGGRPMGGSVAPPPGSDRGRSAPAPAPPPPNNDPPATTTPPSPQPPGRPTLDGDPWKNKPKIDDSPFAK